MSIYLDPRVFPYEGFSYIDIARQTQIDHHLRHFSIPFL